jgi:hypothetical protein
MHRFYRRGQTGFPQPFPHRPGNFRDAKKRPCLGTVFSIDCLDPGSGGFPQPARSTNPEQAYAQQQRGTRLRYIIDR